MGVVENANQLSLAAIVMQVDLKQTETGYSLGHKEGWSTQKRPISATWTEMFHAFLSNYVIRATSDGSCVYALLPGKIQVLYTDMLQVVVNRCQFFDFNPSVTNIVKDFEMVTTIAALNVINNLQITECSFHPSSNM